MKTNETKSKTSKAAGDAPEASEGVAQIVIKEGRYFVRQWFFSGVMFDWLAALWRDPGGPWTIQYRFRYVVDDKLGYDSEDEKSWWRATLTTGTTEAAAEALTQEAAEHIRAMHSKMQTDIGAPPCSELESIAFYSDNVEKNFGILAKQKWTHVIPTQKGGEA